MPYLTLKIQSYDGMVRRRGYFEDEKLANEHLEKVLKAGAKAWLEKSDVKPSCIFIRPSPLPQGECKYKKMADDAAKLLGLTKSEFDELDWIARKQHSENKKKMRVVKSKKLEMDGWVI